MWVINEFICRWLLQFSSLLGFRVASMVSQFTEGLNSCGGLWDLVKCHWETFLPVMTGKEQRPLTLEEFKELFTLCYSHADTELRAGEEATVSHWETVLTFVRGKHRQN